MSTFEFDHELTFTTIFDASVITNSQIPDKDAADFQAQVQEEVNKINSILTIHQGVTVLSSFVLYNSKHYKITVKK
jgi:hypothetical protein